jgi:hypothetical protein
MNSLETDTLQEKLSRNLVKSLPKEQLELIRISFYRFPDDGKPVAPGGPAHFTFYPEYPRKERAKKNRPQDQAGHGHRRQYRRNRHIFPILHPDTDFYKAYIARSGAVQTGKGRTI